MKHIKINGRKREVFGKKGSKDVRRDGFVPAILYGGNEEPVNFAIDMREVNQLIFTPNSYILEFDIDGKKEIGVLRDIQYHPVKDYPMHIDFFRVITGKPVIIDIPIRVTGSSIGVKQGGKFSLQKRKLRVSGLLENLPDDLVIDITKLGIGKTIFTGDLSYENLTILNPATTAVCSVFITRAARGAAAAAALENDENDEAEVASEE